MISEKLILRDVYIPDKKILLYHRDKKKSRESFDNKILR